MELTNLSIKFKSNKNIVTRNDNNGHEDTILIII